jgi:hypothetical protein
VNVDRGDAVPRDSGPGPRTLDLGWQPQVDDYREAYRARNRARRVGLKLWVMGIVCAVLATLGFTRDEPSLGGAGLGGLIALLLVVVVLQPRAVKTLWKRNPALRAPTGARLDSAAGVATWNDVSSGHIQWPGVHSTIETEHLFLVQLAGGSRRRMPFIILAKRGLADSGQVDVMRAMLAAGTGQAVAQS